MIFLRFVNNINRYNLSKFNTINFLKYSKMAHHESRLSNLLKLLTNKNLDALVVERCDPHSTEIPHESFDRVSFISGFTGSFGVCLVTHKKCYLWTDSRYFLQAERELSQPWVLMKLLEKGFPSLTEFLSSNDELRRVGFDVYTTTHKQHQNWSEKLKGKEMVGLTHNPVDEVWGENRTPFPLNPLKLHPLKYSGVPLSKKLESVREEMNKNDVKLVTVTNLDEVAYMLNLRGSDVVTSPIFYAYLVVELDKLTLFVDPRKLTDEVKTYLSSNSVETRGYDELFKYLEQVYLPEDKSTKQPEVKMWVSGFVSFHVTNSFLLHNSENTPRKLLVEPTPVCTLKACKNETELKCMAEAHVSDGMALAKFFGEVYEMRDNGTLFNKDEYELGELSSKYRYEQELNDGLSFPPISGVGPNAAVVHYRARKNDCSKMGPQMYLLDSGGQYLTGTTDVTRTVHFGEPNDDEKRAYTLVLKGHLALRHAKFPEDTPGQSLDVLARQYLWNNGYNYYHGTGHGVGSYLNVHEGPCHISSLYKPKVGNVHVTYLKPGMVLSNEPGYYEAGKFGVRIENMVYVKKVDKPNFSKDHKEFYEFDDLTLVPYCKELLDLTLLTKQELNWINEYHKRVYDTLVPRMKDRPGYEKGVEYLRKCAEPL